MHRVTKYVAALAAVGVALALKYPITSLGADHPFLFLPAAVIVATWYGGRGPGVLATIVAAIGADVMFLPPAGLGATPGEVLALFALVGEGLLIVAITVGLHVARERAIDEAHEAERARRSAALALQMREELLRLWSQKLAGPLAHVLTSSQRAREALGRRDAADASAALDELTEDVGVLQRTAERWIESAAPGPSAS
ncbi:MAG TPA: DUF4118 domain-containing protein [Candidatus Limnocylindria bacterium]|nr:DUF4118 domain-containing protein [Candidatus Limnocylindria bacterium]